VTVAPTRQDGPDSGSLTAAASGAGARLAATARERGTAYRAAPHAAPRRRP